VENRPQAAGSRPNVWYQLGVSYERRASAELVKRIRKLRWIGMDEEADRLRILLCSMPAEHRVVVESPDTD
jgi:hypothetical protein